jgi:uncharacterized protein (TIGR03437 family)
VAAVFLLAALAIWPLAADSGSTPGAPTYSADSIANSAAGVAGLYAPNTFISIYGQNLAYATRAITPGDIAGSMLPTALPGTGVRVLVNGIPAAIWYVSPTLVNALIPNILIAGPAKVVLEVNALAGPSVTVTLGSTAPALYQTDATTVLGVRTDSSLITAANPARGGDTIILFATGLGTTVPPQIVNQMATTAAPIADRANFHLLLNGAAVASSQISYVGAAPGTAGVYQINLTLPTLIDMNPEIRIMTADAASPPGRFLPTQ